MNELDIDTTVLLAVEQAFTATCEQYLYDYWTLVLPPRPKRGGQWSRPRSQWYSTDLTLRMGCFMRERDAHIWAYHNLKNGPYSVKFLELPVEPDAKLEPGQIAGACSLVGAWPADRDCLKHDTAHSIRGQSYERYYGDEREWDDPTMGGRENEPREN
jgi:hypothetical protein